ncbi:hypothetical protein [Rickettsia prowazekii]|uniref:Uncharacterized protein n=1 Tax=Rickettsia prowazekii (strain Rp22) TaxID=449216 RepID=D5AXE3_RICPP|nr:hypothetical protein [Rickettsia prowazekii]EOB09922.1 hypothetical protein H376_8670 [Rickettsia prowazekii str. GvF12]ADE30082.1 conserved hypothetical protein [Rickettsia prowazekii str. Rp22]AFE49354.1 hypothetical protein M9W_02645 [Rickettsia prowazekii str. Chernikova]AFE50198.1 hypothetical protein M9Y_02650 [Rickettsia prowazekii str. Katsinyian]AFE51044.1 hypothetical protein MA1_02640 [Rickettsia prowazekii str. BuV67-CWPP]
MHVIIPDEHVHKLVNYILQKHFEKLMRFIILVKLTTYIDNDLALEELIVQ